MASVQGRPPNQVDSAYAPLLAMAEAAGLADPGFVVQQLEAEHGITTVAELVGVLEDPEVSKSIKSLWRLRLSKCTGTATATAARNGGASATSPAIGNVGGRILSRWRPSGDEEGPEIVVMQGDLTECKADAIVNAANSDLLHGGGVAGAISRKGGRVLQDESSAWVKAHGRLPVGSAMFTSAGRLPARYVIHTVGPNLGRLSEPTPTQTEQLRSAVQSALVVGDQLGISSIALPGISTGIFGYPLDQGAHDIVRQCAQFCREQTTSTIRLIVLVDIDNKIVDSFKRALENAARSDGASARRPSEPARQNYSGSSGVAQSEANDDPSAHKAAGVLPIRVSSSGFDVLLGVEYRPFDNPSGQFVHFLGGKRDHGETAIATAGREFSEEVGGILQKKDIHQLLRKDRSREMWIPFAKYMLYTVYSDKRRVDSLPEEYAKRKRNGSLSGDAEHECLLWVPWLTLVFAVQNTPSSPVIQTPRGVVSLSSMLTRFVKEFGDITGQHMEELGTGTVVREEGARINRLKAMNDEDLISSMTQQDWKLRLTSPPIPPPPPIELLKSHDADYKSAVSSLPPELSASIVSVRRVRASARIGDYKSHIEHLQALNGSVNEEEPLYHGTPERWRATAIALNGFDLSIRLAGRSHGDGVYTATDANFARSYSRDTGSILCLRGAIVSNCQNPGENTILPGDPIRVFPNPKCVLPRLIIDLAEADSRDTLEMQRQRANDEHLLAIKKRKAMEVSIMAQEAEFSRIMAKRLRNALAIYTRSFKQFKKRFLHKQNSQLEAETASGSPSARDFFMERQQFATCSPMYEVKPKVVEVLKRNQVVILTADTGSGKSTQLPQIILDNVLPPGESRRIAVLEPRRLNAISLSRRVAEERGLPPGHEVGYTIGRGESNVTRTTRIEFMTHGLFVQIARNCDQLLSKYCAVIVDEAHERSVDVDLSLALLKRALTQLRAKSDEPFFKVIVTSATITSEAQHFRAYLDPSKKQSSVFQVRGRVFPVHIDHRPVVDLDPQEVGTAGVNKVLTSAAIQTAMDILRTTETGNILIFLASEGSINDALEVARQDLLVSSGVEATTDSTMGSLRSSAFSFRMVVGQHEEGESDSGVFSWLEQWVSPKNSSQKTIAASIVGFHGKITRAERDQVLNPPPDRRLVIFSTNVAETGVTLPDIRYVVDTGLQRRVQWNASVDVNEMITQPITMSSMKQRTGRAGRTASGICIRLFPDPQEVGEEENDSDKRRPGSRELEPGVQNAMIYKVVLLGKHMKQNMNEELELLDPVDPSMLKRAEERLRELGVLDGEGKLTAVGDALLSLGIDLRLGRFLIACSHFGCLVTGTKLVSLLMASDGAERLLPDRKCMERTDSIQKYVDESGDHLTLLNLAEGFDEAQGRGKGLSWCQDLDLDVDVFVDAETSREYLLKTLDGLKFNIIDDKVLIQQNGGIESSIRRALCAAYFDHLASPRADGTPRAGFVRVLDAARNDGTLNMMAAFAGKTQPNTRTASADGDDGSSEEGLSLQEPVVKASRRTSLWLESVSSSEASRSKLVVFGSQMLTDGSKNAEPTVQLISYVTEDEVSSGAANWCRLVDLKKLLSSSARDTMRVQVTSGVRSFIVADRGRWLKQLKRKFSSLFATTEKNEVVITCPRRIYGRVELHVKKLLRNIEPESVTLQLPEHVNMGKIIGKGGRMAKQLEANVQELLSSERCGAGHLHAGRGQVIKINSQSREIVVTLEGASKALMSVIVGRIQSLIVETHGDNTLPLVSKPGQQLQQCPRLAQLMNKVPPTSWATRDDIMLQLAHALVWHCHASIYGGFLRDWVVRGESANDIDVRLSPPQVTASSVESALRQFLVGSVGAAQHQVEIIRRGKKRAAFALTFGARDMAPIDVDLVDPSAILKKMHPGVDCDAGNLLLNRKQALCKKVEAAGDSLCAALENVLKKRFVFYYALDTRDADHNTEALRRLRKYLSRNWTCLSALPASVICQLSSSERSLIKPRRS